MRKTVVLLTALLFAIQIQVRGADRIDAAGSEQPKFTQRPPQFIVLGVDDCHTPGGLDGLIEIMDAVREEGGRPLVYVLYVAPSPDFGASPACLSNTISRLQQMFDRGVELGNHSLNHTAGGGDLGLFADTSERFMEKAQCNIWLRENIRGLDKIYGYRTDREFMDRLNGEYLALVPDLRRNIVNSWRWPYRLKGMESIWAFYHNPIDLTAPPFHPDSTRGITSDWGIDPVHGFGSLSVDAGVELLKANFAAHYNSAERTPFTFCLHDFNFQEFDADDVWAGCEHAKEIWKKFLIDILATEKNKYSDTYCITPHQLLVYMNTRDLQQTLAEGNGQKCKPGEVPPTPENPSREMYRKFRRTFIHQWNVLGPFDTAQKDTLAERALDSAQWKKVILPEDVVVLWLEKSCPSVTNAAAYSLVYVQSPAKRSVQLRLRGAFDKNRFQMWLNDQALTTGYQWPLNIDLQEGWNKLLVRTESVHLGDRHSRYEWYFNCRITDLTGKPMDDLVYRFAPTEGAR